MTLYSRDDDKHEAFTENKAIVYLSDNFINESYSRTFEF